MLSDYRTNFLSFKLLVFCHLFLKSFEYKWPERLNENLQCVLCWHECSAIAGESKLKSGVSIEERTRRPICKVIPSNLRRFVSHKLEHRLEIVFFVWLVNYKWSLAIIRHDLVIALCLSECRCGRWNMEQTSNYRLVTNDTCVRLRARFFFLLEFWNTRRVSE